MREIKCRAWDTKNKVWITPFDIRIDCSGYIYRRTWGESIWERTTDVVLMQYTGLKDKNGKDLDWWEGDIFDDAEVLKVIVKDKGCFWFENIKSKRRIPCYQVAESDEWPHDIRKVGNATENSELLGETNEPDLS